MLDIFEVAVRYQMYHALALLALGWVTVRTPTLTLNLAGWLMVGGTVVFSGTLYILALTGIRWLGAITPLGRPGADGGVGLPGLGGLDGNHRSMSRSQHP